MFAVEDRKLVLARRVQDLGGVLAALVADGLAERVLDCGVVGLGEMVLYKLHSKRRLSHGARAEDGDFAGFDGHWESGGAGSSPNPVWPKRVTQQ